MLTPILLICISVVPLHLAQDPLQAAESVHWEALEARFLAGERGAGDAIVAQGNAAIPLLVRVMANQEAGVHQFLSANLLGEIGTEACIDPLMVGLKHPWFNVRRCAALALGKMNAARSKEAIQELADLDPFSIVSEDGKGVLFLVRESAQKALGMFKEFTEVFLEDAAHRPPIELNLPKKKCKWPFPGGFEKQNLYNNYQQPTDGYVHAAMDLLQEAGTKVRAVQAGTVALIATNYPAWDTHHFFIIEPEAGSGEGWNYTHVDPSTYTFKVGDKVRAGEVLGKVVDFSLGDNDGIDHLHLHYVAFEQKEDLSVEMHSLFDPLQRFSWTDEESPTIHLPFHFVRANSFKEFEQESGVSVVNGKVDILATISDMAHRNHISNWMTPVVTLEITSKRAQPWRKLVLDQRGAMHDERQTRALYLTWKQRKDWTSGLAPSPVPYVLVVTNTDGDGVIEADDAWHAWNTSQKLEDGSARFPDGEYQVTLRTWDLAGNMAVESMSVQVRNQESGQ